MSQATTENKTLTEKFIEFYRNYYRDDIGQLAQRYPKEQTSLYIEYDDLFTYDKDLAEDWCIDDPRKNDNPDQMQEYAEEALRNYDLPADVNLSGAHVRLTDTRGALSRLKVGDIESWHLGDYVAIRAQVGDVTGKLSRLTEAAFECQRCGTFSYIPQGFTDVNEPHECQGCERQGPFLVNHKESEFVDQVKLKLEQPPEEQVHGAGEDITAYVLDDLIHAGGEHGLQDTAGSRVTALGKLEIDSTPMKGRGPQEPVVDKFFKPQAFVFDEGEEDAIDVENYREEVNEFANRPDAIDVFRNSIDPGLTMTPKWEQATVMAVAWLFAAPRIDPDDGDMIRGDLHMLFVSDPGMRKSVFAKMLAAIAPQCLLRDAGGFSSGVGLTSSASQDDFGGGKWTLTPGALPRANGGHLILDEVDKGPSDALGGIHGALEGEQKLKVNKADINATLATRVGFLALGNPVEGRFDPYEPIAEQIDLDPALMSRFDLIVTMQDSPDRDMDGDIATGVLDSIDESARIEYGNLEAENAESVTPEVPRKVMKAWVKIAREEINPLLTKGAKSILKEFYVDTRQLNAEDSDTPPATARTLVAGVRIAMAFARCELSETVEEHHAQRAVNISKTVVGENFDPDTGEFDANRTTEVPSSQDQRVKAMKECLRDDPPVTITEIVEETGIAHDIVKDQIDEWFRVGDVYEPTQGEYRIA